MSDGLARAAAITAVGQLAGAAGFDASQRSAGEILGELLLRYIGEVGASAHAYAESAGRTEATPVDVLLALNDLGTSLDELNEYIKLGPGLEFGHSMAPFPVRKRPKPMPTFADRAEVPPPHVPAFLPAFPDKHTYMDTPVYPCQEADAQARQLKAAEARRAAEQALVRLQARSQPGNRLLAEEAAVAVEAERAKGGQDAAGAGGTGGANPFLAAPLWEQAAAHQQEHAPAAQPPVGGPPAAGGPEAAAAPESAEPAGAPGAWESMDWGSTQPAKPAGVKLDLSKGALHASRAPAKDAYGEAHAAALATKHGRRKRGGGHAAAAPGTDPVALRVDEIMQSGAQEDVPELGGVVTRGAEELI